MLTTNEYIKRIKSKEAILRNKYGITSMSLFGSVSRGEQMEGSDVDIYVDMAPNLLMMVNLKRYLETTLETPVDVVRKHKHINPYLLKEIDKDGILIF